MLNKEDVLLASANTDDVLLHYGVPGMRWGVRKARYYKSKRQRSNDTRKIARVDARLNKIRTKAERTAQNRMYDISRIASRAEKRGNTSSRDWKRIARNIDRANNALEVHKHATINPRYRLAEIAAPAGHNSSVSVKGRVNNHRIDRMRIGNTEFDL